MKPCELKIMLQVRIELITDARQNCIASQINLAAGKGGWLEVLDEGELMGEFFYSSSLQCFKAL